MASPSIRAVANQSTRIAEYPVTFICAHTISLTEHLPMGLSELSKKRFEFTSFKCVLPISQSGGLVQDLLIQLSPDPSV